MNTNTFTRIQLHKKMGWGYKRINFLIKMGQLKLVDEEHITSESVNDFLKYMEKIKKEYISLKEFIRDVLGGHRGQSVNRIKKRMGFIIKTIEFPFTIDSHRSFVSIASIEQYTHLIVYSGKYMSMEEASQKFPTVIESYRSIILYKEINILPYKGVNYISKKEIENLSARLTEKTKKQDTEKRKKDELIERLKNTTSLTTRYSHNNVNELIDYFEDGGSETSDTESYVDVSIIEKLFDTSYERVSRVIKRGLFGRFTYVGNKRVFSFDIVKQRYESALTIKRDYYSAKETKAILGYNSLQGLHSDIRRVTIPVEAWLIGMGDLYISKVYLKRDIDEFIFKRTGYADPHKHFIHFYKDMDILSSTKEILHLFSEMTISNTSGNKKNQNEKVKLLLLLAKMFEELECEIYQCSDREILILMESMPQKNKRTMFYKFLKFLSERRVCKFNLSKIKHPKSKDEKNVISNVDYDIYTFEELKKIYKYATDIKLHLKHSLENNMYASTWLYILLHLSNAWRSRDIVDMPKVFPEEIGVYGITYFNDAPLLSLAQGQIILNQINFYELRVSKTNVKRNFYCNIDLVIPIATVMCITEFHRRKCDFYTDKLMNFPSHDGLPTKKNIKKFFILSEDLKGLHFVNRKMNRSVLTHLYYSIQRNNGEGNSAFEIVNKLRNHISDTTKRYINRTSDFDEITKSLFHRGEFGFLYNSLLDLVSEKKDFIEQTNEIEKIKEVISPKFLEIITGYIQSIENEKLSIVSPILIEVKTRDLDIDQLEVKSEVSKLSPNETLEIIRKIYLKELPSREKHVQCFTYPECFRESSQFDCKTCKYSIPNFMVLDAVFFEFESRIDSLKNARTNGTKIREENFLKKLMSTIGSAIDTFGGEFVWSFLKGGEGKFEKLLLDI